MFYFFNMTKNVQNETINSYLILDQKCLINFKICNKPVIFMFYHCVDFLGIFND